MNLIDNTAEPTSGLERSPKRETPSFVSRTTRSMLEGLSLAHALVVAIDRSGGMAWMSSEMDLVYPGAANCIGQSIEVLLDEAAVTMSAGDEAHFKSRARAFVDELNESGRVAPARFDVGLHPARAVVEVSAFRFETDDGKTLGVCMASGWRPRLPLSPSWRPPIRTRAWPSSSMRRRMPCWRSIASAS